MRFKTLAAALTEGELPRLIKVLQLEVERRDRTPGRKKRGRRGVLTEPSKPEPTPAKEYVKFDPKVKEKTTNIKKIRFDKYEKVLITKGRWAEAMRRYRLRRASVPGRDAAVAMQKQIIKMAGKMTAGDFRAVSPLEELVLLEGAFYSALATYRKRVRASTRDEALTVVRNCAEYFVKEGWLKKVGEDNYEAVVGAAAPVIAEKLKKRAKRFKWTHDRA